MAVYQDNLPPNHPLAPDIATRQALASNVIHNLCDEQRKTRGLSRADMIQVLANLIAIEAIAIEHDAREERNARNAVAFRNVRF